MEIAKSLLDFKLISSEGRERLQTDFTCLKSDLKVIWKTEKCDRWPCEKMKSEWSEMGVHIDPRPKHESSGVTIPLLKGSAESL